VDNSLRVIHAAGRTGAIFVAVELRGKIKFWFGRISFDYPWFLQLTTPTRFGLILTTIGERIYLRRKPV
jgi:hypothetical protein